MADNYLEKRYEEVFGSGHTKVKRVGHTLDELLLKNRSQRGYLKDYVVRREELERIVGVCSKIPSARNQQVLRFQLMYNLLLPNQRWQIFPIHRLRSIPVQPDAPLLLSDQCM